MRFKALLKAQQHTEPGTVRVWRSVEREATKGNHKALRPSISHR